MTEIEKYLKEYLEYLQIEKNRSPKTKSVYKRCLEKYIAFAHIQKPEDITNESVRTFRVHLAEDTELKRNTQAYYIISIRNFLKYLIKRDQKVMSPEKIELPQMPKRQIEIIEYTDLERLLAAPKGSDIKILRDRAILETLFSTGLRVSELCALNRQINLDRGELTVRGKGGKLRIVFFSEGTKKAIKEYLSARGDIDEALFVSFSKSKPPKMIGRITPRSIQRLIAFYAKAAGIPRKVSPHTLRHLFATDLLINGADLRSVQEMLGHSNIQTTQIYTHLTNQELKDVHKAFHGRRRDEE
ncbi:MAG: tyrosine-type recombinase/integrase [Candidatus Colwellbacteria bacterium]|nr:tyrosine-type recombinase/integrase [Candidatus Colwellbacteria bacterium]